MRKFILPLMAYLATLIVLNSCDQADETPNIGVKDVNAKIMVISDVHYFDPSLLVSEGVAFSTYLAHDRKLLKESKAITQSVIYNIKKQQPDVLLIPGDLTKDGEKVSHENLKLMLDELRNEGIKVLVINGNHDINNDHAMQFDGDVQSAVPTVTPEQFVSIWSDYGYNSAIERDPNSLSYVCEPVDGLRILALDVCKYSPQKTSGVLKEETETWAIEQIGKAKMENKTIFGMMHHGLLEHYKGQAQFFSEYLLDNYLTASTALSASGLQIMFTGHYHANDIVEKDFNGTKLYDIETGSTVTWPCPYRTIRVEGKKLTITTETIDQVDGITDFQGYAKDYLTKGVTNIAYYMLVSPPYRLPEPNARALATPMTNGFVAHYGGDEAPSKKDLVDIETISQGDANMGMMLGSIWTDMAPADNSVVINLD